MNIPQLNKEEARVIGCLMEKSITTPDQYPLTLNALTNACNQKSSRNPVMSLDQGTVQRTLRSLNEKKIVDIDENFRRGVDKYMHSFFNSRHDTHHLSPEQHALVCLLLLRGPQTPGELRSRSGRLHSFADNSAVVLALSELIEIAMVVKLPRQAGRKDAEYMHLFSGSVDIATYEEEVKRSPKPTASRSGELERRVETLEAEVAALKKLLG